MRNKAFLIFALAYAPLNGLEILFYSMAGYTTGGGMASYFLSLGVFFGGCFLLFEKKEG